MTRDEVRAWAATLDDDARARWLTLLDALDWERARADKAEADAAAMRVALFSGIGVVSIPRCVVEAGSYCGTEEMPCACDDVDEPVCRCGNGAPCDDPECIFGRALDGTAGRALLDEVAALRAQVADLTRERDDARNKADEMRQAIIDKVVEGALDDVLANARAWALAAMTRVAELEAQVAGTVAVTDTAEPDADPLEIPDYAARQWAREVLEGCVAGDDEVTP